MADLLSCRELGKAFGAQSLFSSVSLAIAEGDRIGLIGPNGSGKSTLLQIIGGLTTADSGEIFRQRHVRSSYLAQEDSFAEDKSCIENLCAAIDDQHLEPAEQRNRAQALLSRAEFPDNDYLECPVRLLSGGWRKRLAICRALIVRPNLLLMDEPTNHLDLAGILWLEKMLKSTSLPESPAAFLMISHDRRFLENTVSRVIELAAVYPEGTLQVNGNYSAFLDKRDIFLAQQQEQEERLANKVRRENEWLSRGPKARTTKAKARKDAAYQLQDDLAKVKGRNRSGGKVDIAFDATERKTRKLLAASKISKSFEGRQLFADLDLTLSPGTRLGLLGRNGCGKSTLMQILAAATCAEDGLKPDSGSIIVADKLRIVSFDQRRQQLDQAQTLRSALAPDGDSVLYQDRVIHVVSWAKRFLFRPDQLETPVERLSGGEQARILIATLMRQPADILLLDEPTNDLDIPSLDVLEESLQEFPGALVLVTHDRFMLDRLCDQVLGFDGQGKASFFADYAQWLRALAETEKPQGAKKPAPSPMPAAKNATKKLSYKEQREYDLIEESLLAAETRQEELEARMHEPGMVVDPAKLAVCWEELEAAQQKVARLYRRWEELEQLRNGE